MVANLRNLYEIIEEDSDNTTLLKYNITCFSPLVSEYGKDYKVVITYINECYNFKSPFLSEEAIWKDFLSFRFKENRVPKHFFSDIVNLKNRTVARAIYDFLELQQSTTFETLVAKKGLRRQMLEFIQKPLVMYEVESVYMESEDENESENEGYGNYGGKGNKGTTALVSVLELQKANELISTLDKEIQALIEFIRVDQKRFGNYAGYDEVKNKVETEINIATI